MNQPWSSLSHLGFALALTLGATSALPSVVRAQSNDQAVRVADTELQGTLNMNEASPAQWQILPGIGPKLAERIIAYRSRHNFTKTTQLMRVKGVGRKTFNAIKAHLVTEGETTLQSLAKAPSHPFSSLAE